MENPSRPRVLFVDDDAMMLRSYRRALSAALDLVAVASAEEALVALRDEAGFAAVVTDLRMPRTGGLALYLLVVARWPSLARCFVFLTGDSGSPEAIDLRTSGHLVLEKPFSPASLLEGLRTIAGRR